ncbi:MULTISPECIES: entericidin A/B family lipoprotein [Kordiimonadales]|uniref:Entericidin A/B family lipoprotein n=1 Tax=Gimibacter soli TaxID=3024400 RepID=A0AAE9XR20_9PROT|nr:MULTISPECIES: entericidin A/B family lipoprotein [Kordiimonadales]WCL55733.1 entericidin A/B family lipoprotein [Gimibacter soli]
MRKIAQILFPLVALFAISACNTIEGVGEDLESVGKTVSREAK